MKKCTNTCVDKVRKTQLEKETPKKYLERSHKHFFNQTNNSEETISEHHNNLVNKNALNKKCTHEKGKNKKFCYNYINSNSNDYRRKDLEVCLKYFCPLCCENSNESSLF